MLKLGIGFLLKKSSSSQPHPFIPCHSEHCCPTCNLPWSGKSTSGRGRFCLACSSFTIQHPETLNSLELINEFKDIMRAAFDEYEKQHKIVGIEFIKPEVGAIFKRLDIISDW
jgi:hypothetical protein